MDNVLGYIAVKALFILPFAAVWLWEQRGARFFAEKSGTKVMGDDRT